MLLRRGRLRFDPWLPPGWQQLRFRLRAHEGLVEVDIRPDQARHTLRAGRELELWQAEERVVLGSDEPIASRAIAPPDACC